MTVIKLPRGFRFHPTDEEIITDFLKPKILETDSEVDQFIAEVDFYKFEPWDLRSESKIESENMWFFFCKPEKYRSSKGLKRTTGKGFWKITGKVQLINDHETRKHIGKKKTLVFKIQEKYATPREGDKWKWVMQEYSVEPDNQSYVLCRLKKKPNDKANSTPHSGEGKPSYNIVSEVENHETPAAFPQNSLQARGHEEVTQKFRSQPMHSPVRDLTGEVTTRSFITSGEQEESPDEIMNQLMADLDSQSYGETSYHRYTTLQSASSPRQRSGDGLLGSDMNTEGVIQQDSFQAQGDEEVIQGLRSQPLYSPVRDAMIYRPSHGHIRPSASSATRHFRVSYKVGEEAEMRNSNLPSKYRALVLLLIKILFTTFALLVYDAWKLVRHLSRKRRPFVVLCCAVSCYFLFFRNTSGVSHQHTVVSNPAARMLPE